MLTFLVHCPDCNAMVAAVPVDGDDWHEAECWAFLAAARHREECPARSAQDHAMEATQ